MNASKNSALTPDVSKERTPELAAMPGSGLAPTFLRVVFAGVFLLAALPKLLDPEQFAVDLGGYGILPEIAHTPTAILLPWIEVTAAISLVFIPSYREAATVVLLTLLVVFSGALLYALLLGSTIPCGCFGGVIEFLERPGAALVRNAILLGLGGVLYWKLDRRSTPSLAA